MRRALVVALALTALSCRRYECRVVYLDVVTMTAPTHEACTPEHPERQ